MGYMTGKVIIHVSDLHGRLASEEAGGKIHKGQLPFIHRSSPEMQLWYELLFARMCVSPVAAAPSTNVHFGVAASV